MVGLLSVCAAATAEAGPFDLYGAGARGSAMGAQTARAVGPWAVFYNVGAMSEADVGVTVGGFATHNGAQILLMERPDGYDIPALEVANAPEATGTELRDRTDTDGLEPLYALTFGGVTSLGSERLRLGFIAFVPTRELLGLQTHYNDERERLFSNKLHFELIDKHPQRFDVEAGASYRVTPWASFGIGGTFLTGANVATDVYLQDPTDQGNIEINADVHTENRWGLLAGLQLRLPHQTTVGLAYRGPVSFRIAGENRLQVNGTAEDADQPRQAIDWTPKYSPGSVAAGVATRLASFELALDARWVFWSDYRDGHSARPGFEDVVQWRLGLEHDYSAEDRVRLGVGFDPTPIPTQTGRTNYVDNARVLASLGSSHDVLFSGMGFEFSWFLQFQLMLETTTVKTLAPGGAPTCDEGVAALCDEVADSLVDPLTGRPFKEAAGLQTGNPGFPGFTAGGWIGAVGAEVTF